MTVDLADLPTYPDLAGKVVVITGGSRGIGAATCVAFGANGARVAVCGRDASATAQTVEAVRLVGGEAIGILADITLADEVVRVRTEVEDAFGPADVVAPFAGGFHERTPLLEIELDQWRAVVESNLTSTFLALKTFGHGMAARGRGVFVTMASNSARYLDIPLTASYAASKAGIVMLSRHAAKELGPCGVRVNCVAPATTLTDRVEGVLDSATRAGVVDLSAIKRLGRPEDTAFAALYLASASASWITGVTLDVAGGRIML